MIMMNQGHGDHDGQHMRGHHDFQPIPPDDRNGEGEGPPSGSGSGSGQPQERQHTELHLAPRLPAPARRVDHTYRDYSNFPVSELRPVKRGATNFPNKLHRILSDPAYSHIISWMPHGRALKIHNKELLVRDVISKHFVQSKFGSFLRQLNVWGFKRLHQSGNDYNAYYHPCFLRGLPHLISLLDRVKPNQGKQIPHVEAEPNFYEIEKMHPLPDSSAPVMPRHGHCDHPSQPTSAADCGSPPGPAAGYYDHYPPYYPYYSHPLPYHGHLGDPHKGAPPYSSQSSYSPHYDPAPHSHPPPHRYPRPSDPPPYGHSHYHYSHPHYAGPPGRSHPRPQHDDAPQGSDVVPANIEDVHPLPRSP